GAYSAWLALESMAALTVALSNALVIFVLLAGWRRFMNNNFYVVLANLIVFTSMKGIVELGFIIPYYMLRSQEKTPQNGFYSTRYELIIFNISVLADYGVLFFSILIAANRYKAIARS
ncbi:hypothetical protein PFISCL1PPCAC_12668, partial [Pristionchus fissidentatus]